MNASKYSGLVLSLMAPQTIVSSAGGSGAGG
jgi:hypothetical protein